MLGSGCKKVGIHNYGTTLSTEPVVLTSEQDLDGIRNDCCGYLWNGQTKTADGIQSYLVNAALGSYVNTGGTMNDIKNSLDRVTNNHTSTGIIGSNSWNEYHLTESDISSIQSELANGYWVVGNLVLLKRNGNNEIVTYDHAIVLTGYNSLNSKYTFWEPTDGQNYTFEINYPVGEDVYIVTNCTLLKYTQADNIKMIAAHYCH